MKTIIILATFIVAITQTSCNEQKVRAKNVRTQTIRVITVDETYKIGDTITYERNKYVILSNK